ncbi:MAG: hypothetical protein H6Q66_2064 [Firmicutes bacterium]|nr:hypothetical protein [Bacillota bacterium]
MDKAHTNRIIEVDEITSGKYENNVFSFCRKKKQIDIFPFELQGPNAYYKYKHHFDNGNWHELIARIPALASSSHYRRETLNTWGESVKQVIEEAIQEGRLNGKYEKDGSIYDVKVVWINN